jgi:hypothetical protein
MLKAVAVKIGVFLRLLLAPLMSDEKATPVVRVLLHDRLDFVVVAILLADA